MAATAATGALASSPGTFGYDVDFLRKNTEVIVLRRGDAQVAVAPAYQGRVMTSTIGGGVGPSFGWLNYKVIEAGLLSPEQRKGKLEDHIYVFGGEERIWLGPEGGQFSLFFAPGSKFDFDMWHTPAAIDTEPFETLNEDRSSAKFGRDVELTNYSGTKFSAHIEREVTVLSNNEIDRLFGIHLTNGLKAVGYQTENTLANRGQNAWTKEKGLPSIWLLGMYRPSPATVIVIPFKEGPDSALGPKVNDAYFGSIPPDYLVVRDSVLFLRGDGTRRGKVGISPARSSGIAGSYAADSKTLTLVNYNVPAKHEGYVNSMWELQKNPFGGDAVNAYNDGSPAPGAAPLGPFYELETSSPAAALKPGEHIVHIQRTVHIQGPEKELDAIARAKLGVSLEDVRRTMAR